MLVAIPKYAELIAPVQLALDNTSSSLDKRTKTALAGINVQKFWGAEQ